MSAGYSFGEKVRDRVHGLQGVVTGLLAQVETVVDGKIVRHLLEQNRLEPVQEIQECAPPAVEDVPIVQMPVQPEKPVLVKNPRVKANKAQATPGAKRPSKSCSGHPIGEIRRLAVLKVANSPNPMSSKEVTDAIVRENLTNPKFLAQVGRNQESVDRLVAGALRDASNLSSRRNPNEPRIAKVGRGVFQRR